MDDKCQSGLRLEVATRPDREGMAAVFAARPMPSHPFSAFQPVLAFTVNTLINKMITVINLAISPPCRNRDMLQDGENGGIGEDHVDHPLGGKNRVSKPVG